MKYCILGVGCSGKTTFGHKISKELGLEEYYSSTNLLASLEPQDALYKYFNLNLGYKIFGFLFYSSIFKILLKYYFNKSYNKNEKPNDNNTLQTSLKFTRVLACMYVVNPELFYSYLEKVNFELFQFDKVVILHIDYQLHYSRAFKRGFTLFAFDAICLLSQENNQRFLEAEVIIANNFSQNVKTVYTNSFEESFNQTLDFFKN